MTIFELAGYAFVALIAGSLIAGRLPPVLQKATRWLEGPIAPVVVGLLSAILYWWLWGSLNAVAVLHDEAAYLLQAEIFASGRWVAPSPPLPQFFEQFHVYVTPVLAPKYPPGHAMLLVPGVVLGLPGLVPILLSGLTAGLLFALVRRISNPWVALLTWLLWLVAPANLVFRQSYFSETTTGFLLLVAWWSLLDWRESGTMRSMLILSATIGLGVLTRPLTMLAFAVPIMGYVLWQTGRRKSWRQVGAGAVLGAVILMLFPIYSTPITGDWRRMALSYYSEVYFPFDLPGFSAEAPPPLRELPPDMVDFVEYFKPIHEKHTVGALPGILLERTKVILRTSWGTWRAFLAPLALVGLFALSVEGVFALGSVSLLVLSYLVFAHPPGWAVYYLEGLGVVAFVTALGLWRVSSWLMRIQRRGQVVDPSVLMARGGLVSIFLVLLGFPITSDFVRQIRQEQQHHRQNQIPFRQMIERIPEPAVVFVRYGPTHNFHFSLITNVPDLDAAPVWLVYDRGAENTSLISRAKERTPYLFDEYTGQLFLMDPSTGDVRVDASEP